MNTYSSGQMTCCIAAEEPSLIVTLQGAFDRDLTPFIRHIIEADPNITVGIPQKRFKGFIFDLSEVTIVGRELEIFIATLHQRCRTLHQGHGIFCGVFGDNRSSLEFLRSFGYQNGIWSSRDVCGAEFLCHTDTIRCVKETPCGDYTLGDIYEFDLQQGPPTIYVQRTGPNAGLCGRTTVLQPAELLYYFAPVTG
ncbi:hypothetical protein HOB10_02125 [Candidatus Parcubacteria bacterium]|nr:hypothetical protein [Candidatus Parcubacteria bacterium]